jgi:trk system potassium uptake protein TrkH
VNAHLNVRILGWLLVGIGAAQSAPLTAALACGEPTAPFLGTATAAVAFGLALALTAHPSTPNMRVRDAFLVVSLSWLLAAAFGALPYLLTGLLSPIDALFESVAGFTTTGSTVILDLEAVPRSLLLWRAMTQWLGGMGIIVFAIAIVPMLGIGGMQLFQAEMPGPTVDKLSPRIVETARRLLLVYVGFTVVAALAYAAAGMGPYDALCHALTTLSTGGFSTHDASMGSFRSPVIEWVAIGFMFLGGVNFALHFRLFSGQARPLLADIEFGLYLSIVCGGTFLIVWLLRGLGLEGEAGLRQSAFQVVSIVTTTGFGTADFETWPPLATLILLQLMVVGGMAGSTSGGLKGLRLVVAASALRATLARIVHPRLVIAVRYGDTKVQPAVLTGIFSFFAAYFGIAAATATIVAGAGYDVVTCVSAALTAIGNVGPGLGAIGPTDTFTHLPVHVKLTLAFCMLEGRLEIFTLLVLFQRRFWGR